jgi:hypothetical protein
MKVNTQRMNVLSKLLAADYSKGLAYECMKPNCSAHGAEVEGFGFVSPKKKSGKPPRGHRFGGGRSCGSTSAAGCGSFVLMCEKRLYALRAQVIASSRSALPQQPRRRRRRTKYEFVT